MFQGYNLKPSFNQPEVTDSLGKTIFWEQNNVHMTAVHNTGHVLDYINIIKTRQTTIKPLKCFKLHDKNSKIFSDKILLNKSLVLCSVKHYPSTLLKGKLKKIQSILYCYNVGNM